MAKPALRPRFLAPGDRLGKFDLIRQIAVGGMAELYLARTMGIEGFEKLVVVKRILPQYAENQSFVNMFLNEARLSATLHHPHITQVYDIGVEDGDYFFSMEYVHGEDLARTIVTATENGVPLSLDAALTLIVGLCAGLHYAHEKAGPDGTPLNVVHRDVSPSNVLVSYDGAVKLVDFGIARAGSQPAQTRGGLKGKIAYMSPEQCRGKTALDRRSDVFSIGTVLYELTTGQLPFTDETEYGVLNQIVNTDAASPLTLVPTYPPALEAIVMKALARDVEQRYKSALDLQKELEDFAHENRLRVSPLVLARLMSTLFPTRLEEWDHARAQGAFFVEQHVVRTLIESGKTSDNTNVAGVLANRTPPPPPAPSQAAPTAPASDEETTAVTTLTANLESSVGRTPTVDTAVGKRPVAVPSPFDNASPSSGDGSESDPTLASDPVTIAEPISGPPSLSPARPMPVPPARPTPLPPRQGLAPTPPSPPPTAEKFTGQHAAGNPVPQTLAGTPGPAPANQVPTPLRHAAPPAVMPPRATIAGPAQAPVMQPPPSSIATPSPSIPPKPTPSRTVTPFPGGVPIVGQRQQPLEAAAASPHQTVPSYGAPPPAPAGGVLVSNRAAVPDAAPIAGAPSIDVTERVRVPLSPPPARFEDGNELPRRRSGSLFIGLGVAALLATVLTVLVIRSLSKATTPANEQPVAEPAIVEPNVAEPKAAEPVAVEPVAVEPVAVEPVAVEPVAVEPVAVEPVAVEPAVEPKVEPAVAKVEPGAKATPAKIKPTSKVTRTVKKPEKKPEPAIKKPDPKPKKDPAWNEESPFMPVRTDKR